jgi:hypothetical protein
MRVDLKRAFLVSALVAVLAFVAAPLFAAPAFAETLPADVVLYETTENMKITGRHVQRRQATSALLGFAAPDTPLCPTELAGGAPYCTVNIMASDNVSLATGVGPVSGQVTVVVQEPGSIDSPEVVIMRGKFQGTIDFTPILLGQGAFGTIDATLTFEKGKRGKKDKVPFRGTFRVPVSCGPDVACYMSLDALGKPVFTPVTPGEYAIGFPTVRFEINF